MSDSALSPPGQRILCLRRAIMPDCTSHRVARRFLASEHQPPPVAVLAHVDPDGHQWGWNFDDALPRMHLVPLFPEGDALVWLEDGGGNRAFSVQRGNRSKMAVLRASVGKARSTIEAAWLRTCREKRWLVYARADERVRLYPGTPFEISRHLMQRRTLRRCLEFNLQHDAAYVEICLSCLIWRGAHDGSDALSAAEGAVPSWV